MLGRMGVNIGGATKSHDDRQSAAVRHSTHHGISACALPSPSFCAARHLRHQRVFRTRPPRGRLMPLESEGVPHPLPICRAATTTNVSLTRLPKEPLTA